MPSAATLPLILFVTRLSSSLSRHSLRSLDGADDLAQDLRGHVCVNEMCFDTLEAFQAPSRELSTPSRLQPGC